MLALEPSFAQLGKSMCAAQCAMLQASQDETYTCTCTCRQSLPFHDATVLLQQIIQYHS
jgi:hypothetical protein